MKIKKQLQKTINKLTDLSFKDDKMDKSQVAKSAKILKSLPQSEAIQGLSAYLKQLKRKERVHTVYIETAAQLSSAQIKAVAKIAERRIKITKVLVSINKEILGGFKMKVGDEIWDGSVLASLNQVKEVIHG